MRIVTSWDDGSKQDGKIATLLRKYKLPGIFYIPACTELPPMVIRSLASDFEIGGHTQTHYQDIKKLDDQLLEDEIVNGNNFLESITGKKVFTFCYPRGRYDDRAIEILKKIGIKNARTTEVGCVTSAKDPYRTATSAHAGYPRAEYEGVPWIDYARKKLKEAIEINGTFHLFGHGWELEKNHGWHDLETLFKEMYVCLHPEHK